MSYFPTDIPFMSEKELKENGINIPKNDTLSQSCKTNITSINEVIKDIKEYILDADKCISEDEQYIRGWKSAMLTVLEALYKIS